MSFNNSQRAPNVSRYLANLNQIPSAQDLGGQDFFDDPSMDPMANLDFFDFDSFNPDILDASVTGTAPTQQMIHQRQQQQHQQEQQKQSRVAAAAAAAAAADIESSSPSNFPQGFPNFPDYGPAHPQIQPGYHPAGQRTQQQQYGSSSPSTPAPSTGDKRKAGIAQMPSPAELEEVSRMAAEEDKRRRNTAASARFRVKKKQREQALEKQAKDMTDKVSDLEAKVQKLEMENKWLRELITDKKDLSSLDKFKDDHKEEKEIEKSSTESSTTESKDGVGTAAEREEVAA